MGRGRKDERRKIRALKQKAKKAGPLVVVKMVARARARAPEREFSQGRCKGH